MTWLFAVLIVLAMGGIAVVASGRGGSMAPAYDDRADVVLPDDRPLEAHDLRTVRFPLAVRGYRMSDVDALLARLATELEDRSARPGPPAAETARHTEPEPDPGPDRRPPADDASGEATRD